MSEVIRIYIDVYFFLNLAVDLFALFSVEKLLYLPESKLRCFIGAAMGAVYSLIDLFYPLSPMLHIFAALLCVGTVAWRKGWIYIPLALLLFFCAEAFIGGCILALTSLSSIISRDTLILPAVIILLSVGASETYGIIQKILRKRLETIGLTAKLWHRGRCSELLLMIDSGNLARESETGKRVIFVSADAIEKSTGDTDTLFERERCYVIPISTASGKGNVLGFIPDRLEFSDKKYNKEDFIVVPDQRGSVFGGYDGIAPLL